MKSGLLALTALLLCTSAALAESSASSGEISAATSAAIDSPATNAPVNADDLIGAVWAVMMEYAKIVVRDAREDRKIDRASKDAALRAKEEKLKLEQSKIDAAKEEAAERYDQAFGAAVAQYFIGVASVGIQIGTAPQFPDTSAESDGSGASASPAYAPSFHAAIPASSPPPNMLAMMMDYLKLVQRDAREDRKIESASRDAALRAKEEKLNLEQTKIDAAKKEAAKRYDSASRAGVGGDSGKPEGKAKKKPSDLPARRAKGETAATDDDDALLNAAACRAVGAKGRPLPRFCRAGTAYDPPMHLDRSEMDRLDQLGIGGGGFNPNKP